MTTCSSNFYENKTCKIQTHLYIYIMEPCDLYNNTYTDYFLMVIVLKHDLWNLSLYLYVMYIMHMQYLM